MGMYNAIFDDELLNPLGIYKERLSQSALVAEMSRVRRRRGATPSDDWLDRRRADVPTSARDEATELTDGAAALSQFKMYVAALRIADDFGLDAVGIQYQQGLKDLVPGVATSPRACSTTSSGRRCAAATARASSTPGAPLPHFNEVDEGVAVDALVTNRIWTAMGLDPATTLHDVRWGEEYDGEFVWVFEISGSVPGLAQRRLRQVRTAMRQPPMFFPLGGGTLSGVSKPGEIVWSRVFIDGRRAACRPRPRHGRRAARRGDRSGASRPPTPQWPIMHAVLHGVEPRPVHGPAQGQPRPGRLRARRRDRRPGAAAKAAMFDRIGVKVNLVGRVAL